MKTKEVDLDKIVLKRGAHDPPDNGIVDACVMEVVSYVAGEPWSDSPQCASGVIGAFLRSWNDALPDGDRQRLKPYVTKLIGTAASREVELKRSWMALDWLARAQAVSWLKLAKLQEHADAVAALEEITGPESARKAQPTLKAARDAAAAASRAAARAAAWDAAGDAAGAAAWAAASKALAPTVSELQESAFELLDRMIAVGSD